MPGPSYSYLALGDSYTIGEAVPFTENFPNQAVQLLRSRGLDFEAPEILARTGWTTDELQFAINHHRFREKYDFTSLLIGVNNQYRGRSTEEYTEQFEALLGHAIAFAGGDASHVAVLSIPDWGVTPFNKDRDRAQVGTEIDRYNAINRGVCEQSGVHYIDITPGTREAAGDPSLLAADGLHPSGREYQRWAKEVAAFFLSKIRLNHDR